jgi:hypothetical protein
MIVVGANVVVAASDASIHVVDLYSGKETASLMLTGPVIALAAEQSKPNVVLAELEDGRHRAGMVNAAIYVAAGVWAQTADDTSAIPIRSRCPPDGSRTCTTTRPSPPRANLSVDSTEEVRDGRDAFLLVTTHAQGGPGVVEYAFVETDERGRPPWHAALVPSSRRWLPYPNTAPEGHTALAMRRILHVYPLALGGHRITARALDTGDVLYDAPLPGLDYGTRISSMTADGDDVFLVANGVLVVVDARTGQIRRRIDVDDRGR